MYIDAYTDQAIDDSGDDIVALHGTPSTSKTFIKDRPHHSLESKTDIQDHRSSSSSITDLNISTTKQKKRIRTISSSISSENDISQDNSYPGIRFAQYMNVHSEFIFNLTT